MPSKEIKPNNGIEIEIGGLGFVGLFVLLGWSEKPLRADI